MPLSPLFRPAAFSDLPGWADDDHLAAFEAFRRSAFHVLTKPYRSAALGVDFDSFAAAYADSRETPVTDRASARAFFERHFVPALVSPDAGKSGFVTGFYEPEGEASPVRTKAIHGPASVPPGRPDRCR